MVRRRIGVAEIRFRIRFWRCSTIGMAANRPSCMRAMARMLGTKYEIAVIDSRWTDAGARERIGGRPLAAWLKVPIRLATIPVIVADVWAFDGSV